MKCYEPSAPRAALALTAVAMAAITLGALIVLPAMLDSVSAEAIDVATGPAHVDVPKEVNREEHVDLRRTTLGAQEFRGKRHKSSTRSRTT
jgi:hypothetical protein